MSIAAGTRLGPYEVVSRIGAGGMGEVWKARDTRLDRSVAVKVLPAEFSANAQLKLRFEREAKTISQLNHPNICTLFDVGDDYLVMELLEGESLAERVSRGPLPLPEVLRYGAQIAEALERAHRAGVIHRDLKPANVMITRSGAKLLDFGLAKTAAVVEVDGATVQKQLTQEGTILGTFQYMAPEQLEGQEADARTDLFALGAVLYEMATGRRTFEGNTKTSLIAAIVKEQPRPLSQVQPLTPPALEHLIAKCLEKDPDDRWQSAHDVASELRWIIESGSAAAAPAPIRRRRSLERAAWALAFLLASATAVYFATRGGPAQPRMESAIVAPEGVAFSYVSGPPALSHDGRQLAFVARDPSGKSLLWVRSLASSTVTPIRGTEGASLPFWSPDGKTIGFGAQSKLYKVSVAGGAPEIVADAPVFLGATWNAGGDIVFAAGNSLRRVSAAGGEAQLLFTGDHRTFSSPHFLPNGKRFLYTVVRRSQSGLDGLYVATLGKAESKRLMSEVYSNVAYAAPGWILYSRDGDLRAQRVDPRSLEPSGDPVRVVDRVQYDPNGKTAMYAASGEGLLVYAEGEGAGKSQLVWVGRDGKPLGAIPQTAMFYTPRLSHDEKRIAVDISEDRTAKGDIWIFDVVRGASSRLTYEPANESVPIWSPDDSAIYFFSEKKGPLDLFRRASGGTGTDEPILADSFTKIPLDLSPDGRWLAYEVSDRTRNTRPDIAIVDVTTRKTSVLMSTPFYESGLQFSPDGKWIAYSSDESGQTEIYVQAFPKPAGKWIVSHGGGEMAAWSADGKEIYYLSPSGKLMAVPVRMNPAFDSGTPLPLFDAPVRRGYPYRQYAVTRDSSRFLLNRMVGEEGTRPLALVQNWTHALRP